MFPVSLGKLKVVNAEKPNKVCKAKGKKTHITAANNAKEKRRVKSCHINKTCNFKRCIKLMNKMERFIAMNRRTQGEQIDYVQLYQFFNQATTRSVLEPIFLPSM